jgi:hypothetical protein
VWSQGQKAKERSNAEARIRKETFNENHSKTQGRDEI